MSNNIPETGVKLVAQDAAKFNRDLREGTSSLGMFEKAAMATSGPLSMLSGIIGGMTAAITSSAIGAVTQLTQAIIGVGTEAISTAARYQELVMVARMLGQQQGYNISQTDGFIKSLRESGIEADIAAQTVIEFSRYNLDMAKSLDIARVAQDAAVVSESNSSETLKRLIYGITTQQTEVLKTAGLNVNFAASFDEVAKSLGKTSKELTTEERILAATNAVLKEGEKIAGAYELAMESPSKQLRSLPRYINDIMLSLGTPFLDAFGTVVETMTYFAKSIGAAVSEGGKLYPVLQKIGAFAGVAADGMGNLAQKAIDVFVNFGTDSANWFMKVAEEAFTWGFNISAELGLGIAEGATQFIGAAMNVISGMLSWFLSPGSPPKVAPDIDKWGMAAMEAYLGGFSKANFDVLEDIQSPLSNALSAMANAGAISKETEGALFFSLSKGLNEAIGSGDTSGIMGQMKSQLGSFGESIAELTQKEFALKRSTDAVRMAEDALYKSQQMQSGSYDNLVNVVDEYNKLTKEGASPELLKAKRQEFDLAKKTYKQSQLDVKKSEQNLANKENNVEAVAEEVSLQKQLVDQLVKLYRAQAQAYTPIETLEIPEILKTPETPGGGGGGGEVGFDLPAIEKNGREAVGAFDGALTNISQSFEDMKQGIKDKIDELFEPFNVRIELLKIKFLELKTTWTEEVWPKIVDYYYTDIEPIFTEFDELLSNLGLDDFSWGDFGELVAFIFMWDFNLLTTAILGTLEALNGLIDAGQTFADSDFVAWINDRLLEKTLDLQAIGEEGDWKTAIFGGAGAAIIEWAEETYAVLAKWDEDTSVLTEDWSEGEEKTFDDWGTNTKQSVDETLDDTSLSILLWAFDNLNTFNNWVAKTKKSFQDWGTNTTQSTDKTLDDTSLSILLWAADNLNTFNNWVAKTKKSFQDWTNDTLVGFAKWYLDTALTFAAWKANIWQIIKDWAAGIIPTFTDALGSLAQVGKDIVRGVINGINDPATRQQFVNAIYNMGVQALDQIKAYFGIKSPSQLMANTIGINIPLGIAAGIQAGKKQLDATVKNIGNSVLKTGFGFDNYSAKLQLQTAAGNNTTTNNNSYNLSMSTNMLASSVVHGFATMKTLTGR